MTAGARKRNGLNEEEEAEEEYVETHEDEQEEGEMVWAVEQMFIFILISWINFSHLIENDICFLKNSESALSKDLHF